MKKVYIVGSIGSEYESMFTRNGWGVANLMEDADLVQFTGGSDVTPILYNKPRHLQTRSDASRDLYEVGRFLKAQRLGIPIAGICRGGQFLNVMCGGSMRQDVHHHSLAGTHHIRTEEYGSGETHIIKASSTHHQMMIPAEHGSVLLAHAYHMPADVLYETGEQDEHLQAEAILYPGFNLLCYQPHPEFDVDWNRDNCAYYFELIDNLMDGV